MIAQLAGVALDARFSVHAAPPGRGEPLARARAARWIAANALASRGLALAVAGTPPDHASILVLRADSLAAVLAAIASHPALIDADTLPCRWRLALRALGLPGLDRPAARALAGGASVLISARAPGLAFTSSRAGDELTVDRDSHGFRVRVGPAERTLTA
jgi:hypothetical protein